MAIMKCISCGKELELPDNQARFRFECPHCETALTLSPQGLSPSDIRAPKPSEDDGERPYIFGSAVPEPRAYRFFGYLVLFLAVAIALAAVIAGVALVLASNGISARDMLGDALGLNMILVGICLVFVGIFVLLVCKWLAAIQTHSEKLLRQVEKIGNLLESHGSSGEKKR